MEARHEERYTREQWTWLAWGTLGSQMGWQRARVWGSHVGFHVTMRLVRMGCDLGDVRACPAVVESSSPDTLSCTVVPRGRPTAECGDEQFTANGSKNGSQPMFTRRSSNSLAFLPGSRSAASAHLQLTEVVARARGQAEPVPELSHTHHSLRRQWKPLCPPVLAASPTPSCSA